ncbi:MAG: tetratricopeptide repeat protein [Methylophilaceae bacterium]|nr:tetratricopeptide repeat protein [Methylophilaceae bacterium]
MTLKNLPACLLIASLLGLTACTHADVKKDKPQASQTQKKAPQAAAPARVESTNENDKQAEYVFKYLLAEVASQRGEPLASGQLFFELANALGDASFAERSTKMAFYAKSPRLALEAAKLWTTLAPESIEANQTVAQFFIFSGDPKSAKPYLKKLMALSDNRPTAFLQLESLLGSQPDKSAVLNLVQELAQPYPDLPEAFLAISQAALHSGNIELAISQAERANQLHPEWEIGIIHWADALFRRSPEQAVKLYQGFISKHPEAYDARLNMSKMLVASKRFLEAKQELISLLAVKDHVAEITIVLGLLSAESGDYDGAEKYFKQALNLEIKDKDQIYLYLGQVAEKKLDEAQAIFWYKQVQNDNMMAEHHPEFASQNHYVEANLNIANLLNRSKGVDAAVAFLDEMHHLTNQQLSSVILMQANLLSQANRHQQAFDLLSKAVTNLPDAYDLAYEYAMQAEQLKKYDVLEKQLRRIIANRPDHAQAYNALGYSFADRNINLKEARYLIERALQINPNDHYVIDSLGWVLYRLGLYDESLHYLKLAHQTQADPEISAHLGEVLWAKGRPCVFGMKPLQCILITML